MADDGTVRGRRNRRVCGLLPLVGCVLALACAGESPSIQEEPSTGVLVGAPSVFVDRAVESGLDVVHFNGMSGELFLREITCGGGGLVDVDNDGDLDVYISQGHMLGVGKTLDDALIPPTDPADLSDRLFLNGSASEAETPSQLAFVDASASLREASPASLGTHYGCGVSAADIDNDGWIDLFLANLGPDQLLHHRGLDADGRPIFVDIAETAGIAGTGNSTVAVFFDYDRDGWLDLYVGGYVTFDDSGATRCASLSGAPDYCGPGAYPTEPDHLYRNRRDGTFEDVSEQVGLRAVSPHPALGAAAADFDGDGWLDLYVANDGEPNHLWLSRRDPEGKVWFSEEALLAGCAVNAGGAAEAGMGVDVADYDGDGDMDIFVAHLVKETNTLYLNDGKAVFVDATAESGLGGPSLSRTSFGASWLDYDNDGWLDLLVASGGVVLDPELVARGDIFPLHMKNQLFRNLGGDSHFATGSQGESTVVRMEEVTDRAGEALRASAVSRGVATGDIDNDGDLDALIFNNGGPLQLLVNQVGHDRAWLGVRLVSEELAGDVLHARAAILRGGRPELWRQVRVAGSYNVSRDPRILFGLGDDPQVDGVRVQWPDGSVEEWHDLATGHYHVLRQGKGTETGT